MPATPSITSFTVGTTTVSMTAKSGADATYVEFENSWESGRDSSYVGASGGSASVTYSKPTAEGTYYVYARTRTGSDASSWVSRGFTVVPPRPSTFNWDVAKTAGGMYNLTYSEWDGLLNNINLLQGHWGKPKTTFSRSVSSGVLSDYVVPSANSFNSAASAIRDMNPTIGAPSSVSAGVTVTSSLINSIRNSLNSIPGKT